MGDELSRLQKLGETMTQHGTQMALALAILIVGLLAARWMHNRLSQGIRKRYPENKISDSAFADDIALIDNTEAHLQKATGEVAARCVKAGLIINVKKKLK